MKRDSTVLRSLVLIIPLLVALALVTLLTSASAAPNPKQLAESVARDWADGSISQVADQLGRAATLNVPLLRTVAGQLIEDKIEDRLIWSFSTPRRVGESPYQYEVRATAGAPFAIDVLNRRLAFTISGDFILQVDTQKQTVTESRFDPGSFRFQQTQQ